MVLVECNSKREVVNDKAIEIQLGQGERTYSGAVVIQSNDLVMYSTYTGQNIMKEFELTAERLR